MKNKFAGDNTSTCNGCHYYFPSNNQKYCPGSGCVRGTTVDMEGLKRKKCWTEKGTSPFERFIKFAKLVKA